MIQISTRPITSDPSDYQVNYDYHYDLLLLWTVMKTIHHPSSSGAIVIVIMIVIIGLVIGRVTRDRTGRYLYHWVPNLSDHCVQVS